MCKIRVIFKAEDNRILKDEVYQFDELEISPVDRPSYITCVPLDEKICLNSYFINEEESFNKIVVDTKLSFAYGEKSGRISHLETFYFRFHNTTLFRCTQSLPSNLNIRVANNIKEYLKLYGYILAELNASVEYKEDEKFDLEELRG